MSSAASKRRSRCISGLSKIPISAAATTTSTGSNASSPPARRKARTHRMGAFLYILLCADGSYYVGMTRDSLEKRMAEHEAGTFGGYTSRRRPVKLMFQQYFERIEAAVAAERQVKGWRREKKEAL